MLFLDNKALLWHVSCLSDVYSHLEASTELSSSAETAESCEMQVRYVSTSSTKHQLIHAHQLFIKSNTNVHINQGRFIGFIAIPMKQVFYIRIKQTFIETHLGVQALVCWPVLTTLGQKVKIALG